MGLWSSPEICSDTITSSDSDVYSSDRRVAAGGSGGAFDPRQADSQQRVSGGARIIHQVLFARNRRAPEMWEGGGYNMQLMDLEVTDGLEGLLPS